MNTGGRESLQQRGTQGLLASAATIQACAASDLIDQGNEDVPFDLPLESGARLVQEAEIRASAGPELAKWKLAAEAELQNSFRDTSAVTRTTAEELRQLGGLCKVSPVKCVWVIKPGGIRKCRVVACGNHQQWDPKQQLWTAQAETSSVLAGLRLAQCRGWRIGSLDVKGAFMQAPLPPGELVVVRPPASWVRLGLVDADELWTVRVALYGLRVSPQLWGLERDA